MRQTIKGKLMRLMAYAVVSLVVVGSLGVYGMMRITYNEQQLQRITHNTMQAERVVLLMLDLRIHLRECVVNAGSPAAVEEAVARMGEIDAEFDEIIFGLGEELIDGDSLALYGELLALHGRLREARPGFYALALAGDVPGMSSWLHTYLNDALRFQELGEGIRLEEGQLAEMIGVRNARLMAALTITTALLLVACTALFVPLGLRIVGQISGPIRKLAMASEKLAQGNVEVDVRVDAADEIGILSGAFQKMADSIAIQSSILQLVAEGDYTVRATPRSDKDLLGQSIVQLVENGNEIISTISGISAMVSNSAEQLAETAMNLSAGSSEQFATVESFAGTLHEMINGSEVHGKVTADLVVFVERLAQMMEENDRAMHQMEQSVKYLVENTESLAFLIGNMEELSGQVCGMVERDAGEDVAEARVMAAKCAEMAREAGRLIAGSRQRAAESSTLADSMGSLIVEIRELVAQSRAMFDEVTDCPVRRESTGKSLEANVMQIIQVVQGNMSLAIETSTTGEQLGAQAAALNDLVKRHFKLTEQDISQHIERARRAAMYRHQQRPRPEEEPVAMPEMEELPEMEGDVRI